MKKILVLFLIVVFSDPACAWWIFEKKIKGVQKVESGYSGTLPDIERFFQYKNNAGESLPKNELLTVPPDKQKLLDAPFSDDLFMDVIIKKEPDSQYVNDLHKIIPILQKFKISVQAGENIQKFNAHVNVLDLHVRKVMEKYSNSKEANTPSYQVLMEINYRAKLLGNLKFDANFYSRYMPLTDEAYSPQGIALQERYMAQELERAIDILLKAR